MNTKKVAIVTGGSRGIGKSTALELAKEGFDVIINFVNSSKEAEKVKQLIMLTGSKCFLFEGDISLRETVDNLVSFAMQNCGRIDVLVNNAGILVQKRFSDVTDRDWETTFDCNLKSAFMCTQAVSQKMKEGGSIVNVSSMGGQFGGPKAIHYSASKGAMITFTKSTARVLADKKIRVNAVAPGFIETDMFNSILKTQNSRSQDILKTVPLKRLGQPRDVANAIIFLTSEKASYITGQTLGVNGGVLI